MSGRFGAGRLAFASLSAGAYDGPSGSQLCAAVSEDVRAAGQDRHLRVYWTDGCDPVADWSDPAALADYWRQAALDNHGLYRVERLAGNVGYLDLRGVDEAEKTARTVAAAMALLANTSALLLDLRRNTGGASSGVAFLCSYSFAPELCPRAGAPQRHAPLRRRPAVLDVAVSARSALSPAVWLLVGADTFSRAEELWRTTSSSSSVPPSWEPRRGAAPTRPTGFDLGEHVRLRVPVAYAVNPVSTTNWDGIGVTPDVLADDAYQVAYRAVLEGVLADLGDDPPAYARALRAEATAALAAPAPMPLSLR